KEQESNAVLHRWNLENPKPSVVYDGEHILILNNPAGLLSQKAKPDDVSVVEFVDEFIKQKEPGFKPSVSNRLDRNTSGLILAGKSVYGQRILASMLKDRAFSKLYLCVIKGEVKAEERRASLRRTRL
ncbi:MAG: RNA pseudouridine synthase, partial [Lachnospiraceae bacterium]|nr:RNA pseudouridine synthase [Lachnospiraceae bacterium]